MAGHRKIFQESMELVPVPPTAPGGNPRFMGRQAAWLPGADNHDELLRLTGGRPVFPVHTAAFGGHVYAQSVLAVCKTLEAEPETEAKTSATEKSTRSSGSNLGLHTIHGYFTAIGRPDRPFVYEVTIITRGRSFLTARVEARQPLRPSSQAQPGKLDAPDRPFPLEDVVGQPLGFICFTAIVSFALPRPHSFGADCQETPAQERFASILSARPPAAWDPSPPADIEVLLAALGRRDIVGTFPLVDMKKVDMVAYNADRPLHERRELILYRLLAPMPEVGPSSAPSAATAANAHILVHAYAADRNGLLMAANHLEFPLNDKTASLSNSFVVHCNVADAQMAYRDEKETDNDLAGWWLQEVCFPRAGAGRAIILSKIWSPAGVHVATEYQDGLCIAQVEAGFDLKL